MRLEYGFELSQVETPRFSVEAVEGIGKLFTLAALILNVLESKSSVEIVFHGLNPEDFDLVAVKSPNGFRTYYQSIAANIVPVDVPGATTANLKSLDYKRCGRPMFPLDDDFEPEFTLTEKYENNKS